MPYSSSVKIVSDANGTAHAFLENDGLLWECQWNAEAQRWDQGQVVPGAYGGEKLQALLVDDLWPTSGIRGGQKGNTPGIVLAYRVGNGATAEVFATLGRWGSDGQLSWSEPLLLGDSGSAIEEIALAGNGAGGFQLICQAREPAVTGAVLPSEAVALSAVHKDSELTRRSFALSGNDTNGYSLVDTTASDAAPSSSASLPITAAVSAAAAASPASPVGGNTQFSRNDLQLAPQVLASQGVLRLSAFGPNNNTTWSGGAGVRFSPNKDLNLTDGVLIGQTRTRWVLQTEAAGAPMDWSLTKQNSWSIYAPLEATSVTSFIPTPSRKTNHMLVGSFGFAGYGSQAVRNDIGYSYLIENKESGILDSNSVRTKALDDAAALFNKDLKVNPLKETRFNATFSLNGQTNYQFDSLSPRNFKLLGVKDSLIVSAGFEYQVRKRFSTGGYLQWSVGGSFGASFKTEIIPTGVDQSMPSWLKWVGYAGGSLGAFEGNFNMGSVWRYGKAGEVPKPRVSLNVLNGFFGAVLTLSPELATSSSNVGRGKYNGGISLRAPRKINKALDSGMIPIMIG